MDSTKNKIVIKAEHTGILAIVISLLTLFIFFYQTNLMREQSRLSVKPRLTFTKNISRTQTFNESDSLMSTMVNIRLSLRNNGLGPAIIESNSVINKDDEYELIVFFDEVYPKLKEYGFFTQITRIKIGDAIPASETVDVFSYQYDLTDESRILDYLNIADFYELPFVISIEYSSMYEESWNVTSNTEGHPRKLG